MGQKTSIEWTDRSWNPVSGCTLISPGCAHCYAQRFAERFRGVPGHAYEQGFDLKLWPNRLEQPLSWRAPQRIFVNSMSDLFHVDVPLEYIRRVFDVARRAHWHTFQILTKRAERLEQLAPSLEWPHNVWQGVSVENQDYAWRIDPLRRVPARIRFLSVEPLLGPVTLDLNGIHWVIVGGESGPKARRVQPDWVRSVRDQCVAAGVPFFFKQWGGPQKSKTGRELDGRTWDEQPAWQPESRPQPSIRA